jgi:hypothetical protein
MPEGEKSGGNHRGIFAGLFEENYNRLKDCGHD